MHRNFQTAYFLDDSVHVSIEPLSGLLRNWPFKGPFVARQSFAKFYILGFF